MYVLVTFGLWFILTAPSLSRIRPARSLKKSGRLAWLGIGIAIVIAAIIAVTTPVLSVLWVAVFVILVVVRIMREHRNHRQMLSRRKAVYRACSYLSGLIRIGEIPYQALVKTARHHEIFRPMAMVAEVGGDVAEAFRIGARTAGCEDLIQLARAWKFAEITGTSMLDTLNQVQLGLRDQDKLIKLVHQELAAPRASGRLMAVLPAVGVALGYALGSNPLEFLVFNFLGRLCLVIGTALAMLGLLWSELLARRAEEVNR